MKKLNYYYVFVSQGKPDFMGRIPRSKFEKKVVEIALENKYFAIVNDSIFTKLTKSKSFSCHPLIGKGVLKYQNSDVLGYGVVYEVYTEKNIRTSTIKNKVDKFIEKEFGNFHNPDLSFIK